jgi:dipeptidyl aminopeptidase/acylaminoacyl peptidase
LVLIVWGYLLVFGAPKDASGVFSNFGIGGEPSAVANPDGSGTIIDTSGQGSGPGVLRQLTTRPVAGAAFLQDGNVWYAERGTGYLYAIDLASGDERQLTATTHEKVIDAQFSPSGNAVVFTTETSSGVRTSIETVTKDDEGQTTLTTLTSALGVDNAVFSNDGSAVLYTTKTSTGADMYSYDLDTRDDALLLSLPFSSAVISRGSSLYVAVKAAAALPGYVYRVVNGGLEHLRDGGLGLTAFGYQGGFETTENTDNGIRATAFEDTTYKLPLPLLPEKCASLANATSTLICASPMAWPDDAVFPDDWYKGTVSLTDLLWRVNIHDGEAALLVDPTKNTGRSLDVMRIVENTDGTQFLLINKNDNTLWLFTPSAQ